MARQTPSPTELAQVATDLETFFLPFEASLDLGDRTTYGTTDPAVDLSMVNIRHLNNTRGFRGTFTDTPTDGAIGVTGEPTPYRPGQVVIGSNRMLYQLNSAGDGTVDPVGDTSDPANWTAIGVHLNIERDVDITTSGGPGLIATTNNGITTLQFRGYTVAPNSGLSLNANGELDVTNFSLTDVHTFTTAMLRNDATNVIWHQGDVAIVTTDDDSVTTGTPPVTQGQGTYLYTGTAQTSAAATNNSDWTALQLPTQAIEMLNDIGDVTVNALREGDLLRRNGSDQWVNVRTIDNDNLEDFDSANPTTTGIPGTKIRNQTITGAKIQDRAVGAIHLALPDAADRTEERLN